MKSKAKKDPEANAMGLTKALGVLVIFIVAGLFFLRSETGQKLVNLPFSGISSEAAAAKIRYADKTKRVPNSYIVVLKPGSEDVTSASQRISARYEAQVKHVYGSALRGFAINMPEALLMQLAEDSSIEYIEEDSQIELAQTQYGAPWGLDRVDQRGLPLSSSYNYPGQGAGVHAYIIDTGIRPTHQDFGGRVRLSYDAVGDGQNGNDCHGHGTHVAGTVGGSTYGVAKNVTLHAIRVMGCTGSGTVAGMIAGVNWITANGPRPAVANMSLMVSTVSNSLNSAIQTAISQGVNFVVAAGNNNMDACNFSPSSVTQALVVSATDANDSRATYSNWGTCVDISAPGNGILSASHLDDTSTRSMSGTSMASPHVAGIVALYLGSNPTASPAVVHSSVLASATSGVVAGLPSGTPNVLSYNVVGTTDPGPTEPTPPTTPPPTPPTSCAGTIYTNTAATGVVAYHTLSGVKGGRGLYTGQLNYTEGSGVLRLTLERKERKTWVEVANSNSSTSSQTISYNGARGTYRWKVSAASGTSYTLCSVIPR